MIGRTVVTHPILVHPRRESSTAIWRMRYVTLHMGRGDHQLIPPLQEPKWHSDSDEPPHKSSNSQAKAKKLASQSSSPSKVQILYTPVRLSLEVAIFCASPSHASLACNYLVCPQLPPAAHPPVSHSLLHPASAPGGRNFCLVPDASLTRGRRRDALKRVCLVRRPSLRRLSARQRTLQTSWKTTTTGRRGPFGWLSWTDLLLARPKSCCNLAPAQTRTIH